MTRRRALRPGSLKPPARLFKGYAIDAPYTRMFRERVSCEEFGCRDWSGGWMVRRELLDERMWAEIRAKGLRWRTWDISATERYIAFDPGQPCFAADTHTKLIRDPLFVEHRGAKWGGRRPGSGYQHTADTWVDSFAEHQDKLAEEARRG